MGLGVAQDEAQLRLRTPFCRLRTFKKEGQQMDQQVTRHDDEGTKKEPKMGPTNHQNTDPKMDPNIISLRIGSLRL